MANYDEQKLKAIGLLSEGNNAKDVARQLNIPYPIVLKWKPEAKSIHTKEDLATVLDVDKVILHELAESTKDKLNELVEDGDELVEQVLVKIDSIGILQTNLQLSATAVLVKINEIIEACKSADDILILVEAISKLQIAFFSKGANVNVLNMPGSQQSDTHLNSFKSMQRPM